VLKTPTIEFARYMYELPKVHEARGGAVVRSGGSKARGYDAPAFLTSGE